MYLWKIDPLVEELKKNAVSEIDKMKYIIAFCLLNVTGIALYSWIPITFRLFFAHLFMQIKDTFPRSYGIKIVLISDFFFILAPIAVLILGIWMCFKANGGKKGFIEKFICLSIPITIRVITYVTAVFLIIASSAYFLFNNAAHEFLKTLAPKIDKISPPHTPVGLVFGIVKVIPEAISLGNKVRAHISYIANIICFTYIGLSSLSLIATIWLYSWIRSKIS